MSAGSSERREERGEGRMSFPFSRSSRIGLCYDLLSNFGIRFVKYFLQAISKFSGNSFSSELADCPKGWHRAMP